MPAAVRAERRSRRTKWERRPTRRGWDVTRTTELATVTPWTLRDVIQRAKWVARMAPTRAMSPASRLVTPRHAAPRRQAAKGARTAVARASRQSAIVTGGLSLHVMKIAAVDTEATATAIPAYGLARIRRGSACPSRSEEHTS